MAFISAAVIAGGIGITTATTIATGAFITIGWGTILTAASIAYQVTQSKKMRAQARAAAEARRGFELVVQGATVPLPIVYGRALIGGARVWHKTASNFVYKEAMSSNNTFLVGGDQDSMLNKTWNGTKNNFLFFQQALCQAPISRVVDVIVGGGTKLDEPSYASGDINAMRAAMRIDCHYLGTQIDEIAAANDASRNNAIFAGAAYISAVVCLNQKEPQFQGVPDLQFVIEGRPVGYFTGTTYSKEYQENTKSWFGFGEYTPILLYVCWTT
jgi:hypothetical protein